MSRYTSLAIEGFAVCGTVGITPTLTISVQDAWSAYVRYHPDTPLTPPWYTHADARPATWTVNGEEIVPPTAWFIHL